MQEDRLAYLLHNLPILKDVLNCHIKLAEVVFPHTILVPTNRIEEKALNANYGEIERDVPFGIEGFANAGRRLLRVTQCDDQKLGCRSVGD